MGDVTTSKEIMQSLHKLFQFEMAGVVRYLHYSFMIMGPNRIPIQKWFRDQAVESMDHTTAIGEKITSYGGHPPVVSASVEESNKHDVMVILEESLKHEMETLVEYKNLARLAADADDIALEEMAREFVRTETEHTDEVRKMLKRG